MNQETVDPFDPIEIIVRMSHNMLYSTNATLGLILNHEGPAMSWDNCSPEYQSQLRKDVQDIVEHRVREPDQDPSLPVYQRTENAIFFHTVKGLIEGLGVRPSIGDEA